MNIHVHVLDYYEYTWRTCTILEYYTIEYLVVKNVAQRKSE